MGLQLPPLPSDQVPSTAPVQVEPVTTLGAFSVARKSASPAKLNVLKKLPLIEIAYRILKLAFRAVIGHGMEIAIALDGIIYHQRIDQNWCQRRAASISRISSNIYKDGGIIVPIGERKIVKRKRNRSIRINLTRISDRVLVEIP